MHSYDLVLTLTGGLSAALVLGYITQRLGLSPIVVRIPAIVIAQSGHGDRRFWAS